ncbi:CYTH and CHAD domain-containing protein [Arthrobacter sp. efr-133-TYG-104]|uniref:CYTH and CHAD domain-containing protein n=1 Tax=Arthrobacter sp. efr-133-TYG-104 TaxID=3040324 RepID=UPI00254DBF0B|nr:CYTH and CHAD domain-containing protein [Arthrobacter sp. efr-133-TYG-104]
MATSSHVETEQKFDVDAATPLPALGRIDGVERVGDPAVHTLEAIYFDTRDMALARRRITLRRRTGGPDSGWHLKLPLPSGDRREVHAPLGRADAVPEELAHRVLAYTRGKELAPIATLTTQRTTYALYGADGHRVADFMDDHVRAGVPNGAHDHQPGAKISWREWEVELAADGTGKKAARAFLDAVTGPLAEAGAIPSARTSKLATTLGQSWPRPQGAGREVPSPAGPAVVPVLHYLEAQVAQLLTQDVDVRQGRDDSVHQMRSLTRRIRSVLQTYNKLFLPSPVSDLEAELKSLAKVLGRFRDAEVLHERFQRDIDALPGELLLGPVRDDLNERMAVRTDTAMAGIRARLDSHRYFKLLDDLDAFLDTPPVAPKGATPARKTTAARVNKAAKRLAKRHRAAVGAAVGPERDKAFHNVRKAAKKLRFAAAAAESVHGKRAGKMAKTAHTVQSILGQHQDSAMLRAELLALGSAPDAGASAFTYGVLHGVERRAADAAQQDYLRRGKKARKLRLKKSKG